MKDTGMTRRVDDLGRIVLPVELRRTLGIYEKDLLEISIDNSSMVLKNMQTRMPVSFAAVWMMIQRFFTEKRFAIRVCGIFRKKSFKKHKTAPPGQTSPEVMNK